MVYKPTPLIQDQIEKTYTQWTIKDDDQGKRARYLMDMCKELAETFTESCPPSRELSLALTHLEEAMLFARAAIGRNEV